VDRLAHRIVKQARGTPAIADERALHQLWAQAAADAGLTFTPVFLQHEWEQVILGQDLHAEQAYLTCLRTGRGKPLSKAQRSQVWQAAEHVTAELKTVHQSNYIQLANEATHLLRDSGRTLYRHVIVDEGQDLHPARWRLLRAAVPPGPDDLFIAADPYQRIYDNRVSLASLGIQVRGRSRRLTVNYRTTQEILAWAVPLLGAAPVTGLDGEADSLMGYRSPCTAAAPRSVRPSPMSKNSPHLPDGYTAGWRPASNRTPSGWPPGPRTWPVTPATLSRGPVSPPSRWEHGAPRAPCAWGRCTA
jgi:UvrD-like helicase family protein